MKRHEYCFVLEDDLLKEYFKYLNRDYLGQEPRDPKTIKALLAYQVRPFLFNAAQAKRIGYDDLLDMNTRVAIEHSTNSRQGIAAVANDTYYRCILSLTNNAFPCISIVGQDKIVPSITGSFYAKQPRDKAVSHIKALCQDATEIIVCDRYLQQRPSRELRESLCLVFVLLAPIRVDATCPAAFAQKFSLRKRAVWSSIWPLRQMR